VLAVRTTRVSRALTPTITGAGRKINQKGAFSTICASRSARPLCASGSPSTSQPVPMSASFSPVERGAVMSGDFSRDSFDPHKNFTRVLMQQGRPQLDADWNEQIAIFWHYWRSFVADLIGPYAGPAQNCGFGLLAQSDFPLSADSGVSPEDQRRLQKQLKNHDFLVCPGHFYVNGILCRNHAHFPYAGHIGSSEESWSPDKSAAYLVYLDVWERSVSALEDDWIREPALNGIDTCIRTKVTWRVRAVKLSEVMGSNGNG